MAASLTQASNANLLPLQNWTLGSGSCTGFNQNGDTVENQRITATGPYGSNVTVWETRASGVSGPDGGWNSDAYACDSTATYRVSVWVKRTSSTSSGTFYFGLYTSGTVLGFPNSVGEGNPYWDYRGVGYFTQNQWYLVVGHIFPSGTSRNYPSADSGIYTRVSGKVGPLTGNIPYDCKFPAGATTITQRTYHYYCSDATTRLQFFSPRIDKVDGTEPSVSTLLSQNLVTAATKPEGVKFSDNTYQTTTYQDASTGSADVGSLIGIYPFNSAGSFTWIKPPYCTKAFVKVVGGGGGSAGYTESGGAGGYSESYIDLTGITSIPVVVGVAGTGVGYYAAAVAGGTSSFGSYLSATGGYGANANFSHTGGAGGLGSSGMINLYGGDGTGHSNSAGNYPGGVGGASYWGGGGTINRSTTATKLYAGAPGSGGPGGRTNDGHNGASGEVGLVVIYAYR